MSATPCRRASGLGLAAVMGAAVLVAGCSTDGHGTAAPAPTTAPAHAQFCQEAAAALALHTADGRVVVRRLRLVSTSSLSPDQERLFAQDVDLLSQRAEAFSVTENPDGWDTEAVVADVNSICGLKLVGFHVVG